MKERKKKEGRRKIEKKCEKKDKGKKLKMKSSSLNIAHLSQIE